MGPLAGRESAGNGKLTITGSAFLSGTDICVQATPLIAFLSGRTEVTFLGETEVGATPRQPMLCMRRNREDRQSTGNQTDNKMYII